MLSIQFQCEFREHIKILTNHHLIFTITIQLLDLLWCTDIDLIVELDVKPINNTRLVFKSKNVMAGLTKHQIKQHRFKSVHWMEFLHKAELN